MAIDINADEEKSIFRDSQLSGKSRPFDPQAIRHLPPSRQPHYVRMAIKWALRGSRVNLSVSEIRDKTGLDERTIRDELDNLVSRREVERIRHGRGFSTYRLIGSPVGVFSKHLVRLQRRTYTLEHARSPDGDEFVIIQEREEMPNGSYDPVGGIIVHLSELEQFLAELHRRTDGIAPIRIKGGR